MKIFSEFTTTLLKFVPFLSKEFKFIPANYWNLFGKMEVTDLMPPPSVRGMTSLDRGAFCKVVTVPSITIDKAHLNLTIKKSKKYLLKLFKFDSILTNGEDESSSRQILLNPALIKSEEDVASALGLDLKKMEGKFSKIEVTLQYENWKADQILQAVLPKDVDGCSGFSIIGHILHLNLREHLHLYKNLIADVYLDKMPNITLVVNKSDIIDNSDNTFRSFSMEKLAGTTENTVTTVKENECLFTFDFSKVYWNPRLSTEHERIVSKLKKGDVLFDVMAGVGPFAIPAAKKKKCLVFANDLNPSSFEALKENCNSNKVTDKVKCFNLDGHEFIKVVIKQNLTNFLNEDFSNSIHVTMNLPSIAVDFLPSFIGLFDSKSVPKCLSTKSLLIHTYLFSFNETKEFAVHSVAAKLGFCVTELDSSNSKTIDMEILKNNIKPKFWDYIIEVVNVRKVAPAKVMFRVSFNMPLEVLIKRDCDHDLIPSKKLRVQ